MAMRERVQSAEHSEREHRQLLLTVLDEGPLSMGAWKLDEAEDAVVNFMDTMGAGVVCEALEKLEYLAVYRCAKPTTPEDLEHLEHVRKLLELVRNIGAATEVVDKALEKRKRTKLAEREARNAADMQLVAYLEEVAGWPVEEALHCLEYRVLYHCQLELTDWMHGYLLLVRELAGRVNAWSELFALYGDVRPDLVLSRRQREEEEDLVSHN